MPLAGAGLVAAAVVGGAAVVDVDSAVSVGRRGRDRQRRGRRRVVNPTEDVHIAVLVEARGVERGGRPAVATLGPNPE